MITSRTSIGKLNTGSPESTCSFDFGNNIVFVKPKHLYILDRCRGPDVGQGEEKSGKLDQDEELNESTGLTNDVCLHRDNITPGCIIFVVMALEPTIR